MRADSQPVWAPARRLRQLNAFRSAIRRRNAWRAKLNDGATADYTLRFLQAMLSQDSVSLQIHR